MRAVDSALLVGTLAGGPLSMAAEAFIRAEGPVGISQLVLTETVRALESAYGRTREQMAAALAMILDNKDLVVEEPAVAKAALARYREGLDFEDAMALEAARHAGHLPMATLREGLRGIPGILIPGA
jgi:predicted nucleic-acid-binding protein